jgi:amino acid adenylation domain-containing protein
VQITHRNIIRLFSATQAWFHFSEHDRWSLFHSYAFDFSVWEIWGALLYGGRIVVVPFAISRSPLDFYKLLSDEKITVLNQTPSAFRHLLTAEEGLPDPPPLSLRLVIFGGEALEMKSLKPWFDSHGDENPRLVNMYGITETTVHVTYRRLRKHDVSRGSLIGQPIADLQLHILDENLDPSPVGVPGEIYIGGPGLARGYLNRPELTAERFIPDPFTDDPKARLYCSGDVAQRLADGDIEYLGRRDYQVQVRGFRVELGEIESSLGKHPGVESSVVTVEKDGVEEMRLWAYFIPKGALCPNPAELRAFLVRSLPDYMIPAGFTRLDRWPLTENGKLDRRALAHAVADSSSDKERRTLSATEARLLACCREILGGVGLGVDDPLLESGFHSLAFAHLAWRIQKEFGIVPAFSEMFARRTVAELALLVEAQGEGDDRTVLEPLTPADRREPIPLSFSQERVWFLEKLHPGNNAYYFQSVLRFHGCLDVPALEKALNLLVRRHEILRTAFPQSKGRPFQQIHPFAPFPLSLEEVATPAQAEQCIAQIISESFDFERLCPARWILFRLGAEEHWLLHREHHLLHDGWEYGIFLKELFACYDALAAGRNPVLPPLTVQFADFAVWQRCQLASGRWDAQLDYWQARLHAAPPVLQLPTDRPRPASETFAGAQIRQPLDHAFHSRLLAACAREGVTPYMWLLAAFQSLLFRYTGQTDIVVGSGFANRRSAEAQKLLGMVINTVAMRMDFSGQRSFREVLGCCRCAVLEAADNQDVPFDRVVQRLGPGTVLFNTFIDIFDQPYPSYQNDVLRVARHDVINNGSCKFDIVVLVIPSDEAPALLLWEYSTDLFSEETASRMMRHFLALVTASIDNPALPVAELPMLSPQEREQLVLLSRGTDRQSVLPGRRIEQIFADITATQGDAPAVICQDERLSYRELDRRAEELATQFRRKGARPGEVVAFALPRGPQALSAMLASLKCGCAYLPLDPKLPKARLDVLLRIARPSVLLNPEKIIPLESAKNSGEHLLPEAAYVLFTSGSTGEPKAVCVPHRAVIRLVCGVDYVRLDARTRFLQLAPLAFDASTLEIWGPLLNGGTVVMHPEDLPAFADLGRTIAAQRVTTAWLTASLFNQIVTAAPKILRPLRELLTGGEALSVPHVVRALAELPETTLINGYGPTETTTFATTFTIPRDFDPAARRVPIGRPIPNTQVYVLNDLGQPQCIGVPGELFVGGDGLALGYLGDDQLTTTRFVSDPFSGRPGARLYRTGDRVRWLPDGTLDFIERCDRQVKIRGFRIEPGEVEWVLAHHPAVHEAFVTAPENEAGERRLVAYVVLQPCHSADELRRFLQDRLPDYMVPSALVQLETLPLTPSGKVDRRALLAPDVFRPEPETIYVAPRNPFEEQLASIWCEVLGMERVGVHDHFFALGGHSLLAMRVIARISSALEVDLPVRKLFESPTIAELSREIERLRSGGARSHGTALFGVERNQRTRPPLSFAQQRLWFLEQMEGELTAYNMPFAWRLRGTLHTEALRRALEAVVHRHEPLRTTFALVDREPKQVIGPIEHFELPLEDLSSSASELQEAEVVRRCRLEAERPFDLSGDRMLRAALLRLAAHEHVLLLTIHHIASDGWSLGVLWRELERLYEAYCRGANPDLPPLPVRYADYAMWQQNELQGQRLDWLQQYWREQLHGAHVLELPTDHPRPPALTYQGARHDFDLKEELVEQLKSLSQREDVTLHMMLLAAFQTLLARYSGQDDIVVGMPIAGRSHAALEGLIGFFVNTLVLRTDLSGDPTFRELLGRVRQVSLAAYDHQDLPFEKLVEELKPQRDLSHSPVVQAVFQLLSFSDPGLTLRDVEVERLPSSSQRVRFDVEMHLWQEPKALRGALVYSTDLFDASTMERLVRHFVKLLAGIAVDPDRPISQLPLLTEAERQQVLVDWNRTAVDYPSERCIHELFEEQAARSPAAVAVIFGDRQLTYGELNARANQLARYLQGLGVGPETLVGVCLERSLEMMVGLLGILKAGGAYVPLDPGYPQKRLAFMLADTQAPVLLTQAPLVLQLPPYAGHLVCLDADGVAISRQPTDNPVSGATAGGRAYVCYTSGSTGVPKGVEVCHRGVVRLLFGADYVRLDARQRFLHLSPLAFDASTFEIWGALLHGGRCILMPERVPTARALGRLIEEHGVSVLWLTAALFNSVVDEAPEVLHGVRQLLVGGEALSVDHVRRALQRLPGTEIINGYGPTEGTTFSCCYRIPRLLGPGEASIPIGRAITNTEAYVLDGQLQPVPVGVVGELYLGGVGLARGYLNRPDLTAERFLRHPFRSEPGARVYRTGDRVRWRADGTLEFLGRLDDQVKIRGHRIELGEIEAALALHSAVRETAVVAREDAPGDKRLVAYVVLDPSARAGGSQTENITQWQALFEETYGREVALQEPAFNTTGWNSSYTGGALPAEEMGEWVETTVERIRKLRPARVLEIGCGSGLLLLRVAPGCAHYVGTDFSRQALDYVRRTLTALGQESPAITLLQRSADDFSGIEEQAFDAVILNSVVQYFPSVEYLASVLDGALRAVRNGGFIFVGDVRNLSLLEAFHTSVQLAKAPNALPLERFRERIRQNIRGDKELVIDPAFFAAFGRRVPRVGGIQVQLKRGRFHNELTRFRYDVFLHVGSQPDSTPGYTSLDWREHRLSVSALRRHLEETKPPVLCTTRWPNARLAAECRAVELFQNPAATKTVGELWERLRVPGEPAVDPEELWSLGERLPYDVQVTYSASGSSFEFDVYFQRRYQAERSISTRFSSVKGHANTCSHLQAAETTKVPPEVPALAQETARPWSDYANSPLLNRMRRKLIPHLRRHLEERLPAYMVPGAFVDLDSLPLTPNGKVDRKALPEPDPDRPELETIYVAPRNPFEEQLASIWCDVLGMERVGIHDHFFALGGHSLLALQLIHEINAAFGLELPVRLLFEQPTAAGQAREIERALASRDEGRHVTYAPLVPLRPGGSKPPFFLVAGGFGGEAELLVYAKLAPYLDSQQPFYGLRARGVDELVEPHQTVELMAAEYVREIRTIQPYGPYFIGGSCIGGVVALEIAQQLRAQGEPMGLLVLVDSQLPTWHGMLRYQLRTTWSDQVLPFLRRCRAGSREFRAAVRESISPSREQKISRRKVRIGRKYLRHVLRYKPRPYPGPVTLILCQEHNRREPERVWRDLAGGGLEVLYVPGDHFTHLREHAQATATQIGACLEAAQARKKAA